MIDNLGMVKRFRGRKFSPAWKICSVFFLARPPQSTADTMPARKKEASKTLNHAIT